MRTLQIRTVRSVLDEASTALWYLQRRLLPACGAAAAELGDAFEAVFGEPDQGWQIMRNGTTTIGLFAGMFERNILTFNPGWDQQGRESNPFTDVREIQKELRERNVKLAREADENTTGPASCVVVDPDGNPILIDQHR